MAERTLYQILMLDQNATSDVVNLVYRHLAKQNHPDRAGQGGVETMVQINEAHAILSNPEKRARYDEIIGVSPAGAATGHRRPSVPGATNLKYEDGAWTVRNAAEPTPEPARYGEAGAPPAFPSADGSVLSFGRYRGWSINQVASFDRNYAEWLSRTMAGRTYVAELERALKQTDT